MNASQDDTGADNALSILRHIEMAIPLKDGFRTPILVFGERIKQAIGIAEQAHREQSRATLNAESIPYIDHIAKVSAMVCRNVMLVAGEIDPEDLICAAILHDAFEDFPDVRKVARANFPERAVALLEAQRKASSRDVPRRHDRDKMLAEKIEAFGPPAILVKLCDLTDNVDSSRMAPAQLRDRLLDRVWDLYLPMAFRHDRFYYLAKRLEALASRAAEYRAADEGRMDFAERALSVVGRRAPDWHDFFESLSYAAGFSQYEIVPEEDMAVFCRRYGVSTLDIEITTRNSTFEMQKIGVKSGSLFKKDRLAVIIKSAVVNRYVENAVFLIGFVDPSSQNETPTLPMMALLIDYIDLKIRS